MQNLENSLPEQSENIYQSEVGTSFLGKLKTKWPIVLGALGSLALFAAVIYAGYWYGTQQTPPVEKPSSVSQPISTPTPTSILPVKDETTDWKAYTNLLREFSLKYPQNWKLFYNSTYSSLKPFTGGQTELLFLGPRSGEQQPGVLRDAIGVDILDLRPVIPNVDVKGEVLGFAKEYVGTYEDNITELTISGENAFQTKLFTEGYNSSEVPQVYVIGTEHKNKRLFIVVNVGVNVGSTEDYLKVFDQILSTFKFLD